MVCIASALRIACVEVDDLEVLMAPAQVIRRGVLRRPAAQVPFSSPPMSVRIERADPVGDLELIGRMFHASGHDPLQKRGKR